MAGEGDIDGPPPDPPSNADIVGEWGVAVHGVDDGVEWEMASKSDGEFVCYYMEFEPPPGPEYAQDPYGVDERPLDLIGPDGVAEGATPKLDQLSGCAPVPMRLDAGLTAQVAPEVSDPIYLDVVHVDGFAYHFVVGVVSADAAVARLSFEDGTSRHIVPTDGHLVAVFSKGARLTGVELRSEADDLYAICEVRPNPDGHDSCSVRRFGSVTSTT